MDTQADPQLVRAIAAVALALAIPLLAGLLLQWCLRAMAPHSVLVQRAHPEELSIWLGGALLFCAGAVVRIGYPETPLGAYLGAPDGSARAAFALLCTLFLLSLGCELMRNRPHVPQPRKRAR